MNCCSCEKIRLISLILVPGKNCSICFMSLLIFTEVLSDLLHLFYTQDTELQDTSTQKCAFSIWYGDKTCSIFTVKAS